MSDNNDCLVCDSKLNFRWTDTHGVAVCIVCGTPYRIIHYDKDDQRVEKQPECQLLPAWIAVARKYYAETKRMVIPGIFDMELPSRINATYSGATREDFQAWDSWLQEHESELPKLD